MYLKSAPGLNLWPEQRIKAFYQEDLLYEAKFLVGGKRKTNNIGPFSQGGLEKPNPARTIDTLADGS